jgi:hypothetical protein
MHAAFARPEKYWLAAELNSPLVKPLAGWQRRSGEEEQDNETYFLGRRHSRKQWGDPCFPSHQGCHGSE